MSAASTASAPATAGGPPPQDELLPQEELLLQDEPLLPHDEPPCDEPPCDEPRSSCEEEWDEPLSPTPAAPSTHQLLSLVLDEPLSPRPPVRWALRWALPPRPDVLPPRAPARAARALRRLSATMSASSPQTTTRMKPITAIAFMASPSPLSFESPEAAPRGRLAHLRVAGIPPPRTAQSRVEQVQSLSLAGAVAAATAGGGRASPTGRAGATTA
ncbi:hypothetical protein [Streptomyces scabiei]|uniref:hypothetical protein n=1 Tax=Streptomyces scabiei TaxID=1930 RepID=UPI001B339EBA|nr:hypothetical protein [Streptomyces sp. LBUM 1486]